MMQRFVLGHSVQLNLEDVHARFVFAAVCEQEQNLKTKTKLFQTKTATEDADCLINCNDIGLA